MSTAPVNIDRELLRKILDDATALHDPDTKNYCSDGECFVKDIASSETFENYQRLHKMLWRDDVEFQNVTNDALNMGRMNQAAIGIAQHLYSELKDYCQVWHEKFDIKDPIRLERETLFELKKIIDDAVDEFNNE